jgi:hypothetical protein
MDIVLWLRSWAAAEGVSETVIAAVLLLHERGVDEIVPSSACRA